MALTMITKGTICFLYLIIVTMSQDQAGTIYTSTKDRARVKVRQAEDTK